MRFQAHFISHLKSPIWKAVCLASLGQVPILDQSSVQEKSKSWLAGLESHVHPCSHSQWVMAIREERHSTANQGSGNTIWSSLCFPQLPIQPYFLFILNSLYSCLAPIITVTLPPQVGKFALWSLKDHTDLVKHSWPDSYRSTIDHWQERTW